MRARTFQLLILAWSVLAWAGCHSGHPASSSQPLVVAEPCSPAPQRWVVFDETGALLSEAEFPKAIDWIWTQTRAPVWLIRVEPAIGESDLARVIAYVVPDEATARMRIGRAYYVPEPKDRTAPYSPRFWKYVQVSMPGHGFTNRFVKPSIPELPFRWPITGDSRLRKTSPMSKDEVLSIVDFVHQPSSYGEFAARQGPSADDLIDRILESPISDITRRGNVIDVRFGFRHGSGGRWFTVTLEPAPTGYKIVECGEWISA